MNEPQPETTSAFVIVTNPAAARRIVEEAKKANLVRSHTNVMILMRGERDTIEAVLRPFRYDIEKIVYKSGL